VQAFLEEGKREWTASHPTFTVDPARLDRDRMTLAAELRRFVLGGSSSAPAA